MSELASPLELLEGLLAGAPPTPNLLDDLLRSRRAESLWLDYKSGTIFDEKSKKEVTREVRRHVAGFANAEGGVLIVGAHNDEPDPPHWTVVPCTKHAGRLVAWAGDALGVLAGYLDPAPRLYEVDHTTGPVLVIAVARAPALVPCIEAGRPVHYLRCRRRSKAA